MKVYTLVSFEHCLNNGEICNTWEEAQFFDNMKDAHEAMMSSVTKTLNIIYNLQFDGEMTMEGDPTVKVSLFWATIHVHDNVDGALTYKFQIFEGEV